MKSNLVQRLKSLNLFPFEIDDEAQEHYKSMGIDFSKMETHYSPGTPKHVIDRYERIRSNVLSLYKIEHKKIPNLLEYGEIKNQIEQDLFELIHPPVEDVMYKLVKIGNLHTGIGGIHRDIIFDE